MEFDRLTTKTIPLTAEAPLISAEEGYILKETTTSPSEITIEGPKMYKRNGWYYVFAPAGGVKTLTT